MENDKEVKKDLKNNFMEENEHKLENIIRKSSESDIESDLPDNNLKFDELKENYIIEKLQAYIKKQDKKIKKLKSKLKHYVSILV